MKRLKLFFACLLMAVLSIGQVWATDIELVSTLNASAKVTLTSTETTIGGVVNVTGTKHSNFSAPCFNYNATKGVDLRFYKGSTVTFTMVDANAKITQIEFKKNSTTDASLGSLSPDEGTLEGATWTGNSNAVTFSYPSDASSNLTGQIYIINLTYTTGVSTACATPTFSPAAGAVLSGTEVSISCATDGATIHYTTDGTEPTASSATYSAAIPVTSEMTIKAIAVKDGYDNSSVASAAYTIATPLTTMQAIFEAATAAGSTATPTYITFSNTWVVTGVSTNGKNVYITDGTKGMILFNTAGNMGLVVGNTLSGTVQCNIKLYNGAAELDGFTTEGLTKGTADLPNVQALDAEGIAALTGANTGSLIKISGECTSESSKYYIAGVQLYNQLYSFSVSAGTNYECTGVYVQYNTTNEILPRSAADIVAQTSVANPTFSPAAGEYTEVQNVTLSCTTDGATVYYTTDGTNPTNESTAYSSAIEVGASMTIKAIAYKGEDHSEVVSAAYTINLPVDPEVTCTWDLSAESYVADPEPTADLIQWTSTYVTMKAEKNGGNTGVNNYIPPTRTSTRFYTSNKITFIPANSKQITTIVITAATSGYATALKNATWTNATAAANDTEVTITASGAGNVVCVLGANTGITAVTVNYEPYVAPTTYAVSFAAPEHGSLAIANGEDPISSGDEFVEGTELTVTAEPTSGYILDAIKVIETGSDPENDVTSTVLSGTTLTVPAHAISVSATFVENVAPVATLTLSENGVAAPFAGEHHQGDVVNLPLTSTAECVKEFVGWSANASCAVAPEYAPGAEYTLTSTEQTLYAVYATASGSSYVKTALASIASGSEVVVTEAKTVEEVLTTWALTYNTTSKKTIASVVTETENVLDVAGLTNGFWILTKDGDNFSLTAKGTTDKLYCTNTNDGVRVGEGEANTFSINNEYLYTSATSDARYLGVYNATDFRCYTSINNNIKDQTLAFYKKTASYSDYATTCVAALADPVFTPAAGVYTEAKNVVITAEEGTIHYTLDGTDPTSSSTEYTAPIVLDENGTTTIKAIAISATSQSAIVSATYTINMPLSTIQAVYDKAVEVGGTATAVNIKFTNWVVSGISTDNKNVYVTDGEKGFVIYDSEADHGFAVNDKLNGTVATSLKLYNKYADVIGLKANAEGLTVTHDGVITPVAATIADLGAVNTGAPIILNGVLFDGSVLSDGVNSITPYTTFYADAVTSLESDKYYNITGIYVHFNNTKEIAPRSAADIDESELEDPEISYSPASVEIAQGDAWSAPSLINEHGVTIASYASDNEEVATVTDGGVISLAGGIGTAIITAHSNATPTYAAGNATYTITVNAPAPTPSGTTYRKVTATADITDGEYLIVYEGDATHDAAVFDGSLDNDNIDVAMKALPVAIVNDEIAGNTELDAAVFTIDVTAGSLQSASGLYIGRGANSNGMDKSTTEAYVNTFAITDGEAVITGSAGPALRYNYASDQLRFRYYKSGQQAIQLYKKETVTPDPVYTEVRNELTEGWYYTMCLDKAVTAVKAGSIWRVLSKAANGNDVILEEVTGTLDAGRPYIFRAAASTLEVAYTGDAALAPVTEGNNGLVGSFTQTQIAQAATNYIIYNNELYFVNSDNVYVGAHRAYLDMNGVPAYDNNEPQQGNAPRRRVVMTVHGEQTATGMENVQGDNVQCTKILINGQLFILRGEKLFDATGRLVK